MIASVLMAGVLAASLPSWEFDNPASLRQWVPNGHVANVKVTDGVLTADAIDWDPFFSCDGLEIPATPWQYVIIRLKASEPGTGELYWSGETTGQYGGLSPGKRTPFQVKEKDVWQEIVLFPYWQGEKTIRKLRLDVYQGVSFSVDYIRLGTWCDADTPASAMTSWTFDDGGQSWRPLPTADQFVSPALQVDVDQLPWLGVRLTSPHDGVGTILWGSRDRNGPFTREFLIDGDSQSCYYNVNMQEGSDWKGEIAVLGVELPAGARLEAVQLGTAPSGPARLKPISFGFAEGVNRAGKNVDLCLHLQNVGGAPLGSSAGRPGAACRSAGGRPVAASGSSHDCLRGARVGPVDRPGKCAGYVRGHGLRRTATSGTCHRQGRSSGLGAGGVIRSRAATGGDRGRNLCLLLSRLRLRQEMGPGPRNGADSKTAARLV